MESNFRPASLTQGDPMQPQTQPAVPCTTPVLHNVVTQELVDDETYKRYTRKSCADCGRWIGDVPIPDLEMILH